MDTPNDTAADRPDGPIADGATPEPGAGAADVAATGGQETPELAPGSVRSALIHGAPYIVFVLLTTLAGLVRDFAGEEPTLFGIDMSFVSQEFYASLLPWVDPVRTIATAATLLYLIARGVYPELSKRDTDAPKAFWFTLAAGLIVGVIWVPLAHATPGLSDGTRTGFDPAIAGDAWRIPLLVSRLAGMVLIVPFAEELFVRSLLPRFWDTYQEGGDWRRLAIGVFTPMSFVVSVAFFTFTHPEILAAFPTAVVWTVLLMYTRRIWDVIVAHAIANAMVGGYIVVMEAYELSVSRDDADGLAPASLPPRVRQVRFVALLALVGGWLALPHLPLPSLTLCAFQRFTGLPCPGCGMTRSVSRLAEGDVGASLSLHPLGAALVLGLLAATAASAYSLVSPRDPLSELIVRRGPWLVAALAAALVAVWVVRAFVVPEWGPASAGPLVPSPL